MAFEETDGRTLEESVVESLRNRNLRLAVAESCTAGALAARIVNVPGASDVLYGGFVTYTDQAKHRLLGVLQKTLEQKGAVSEECAAEMAEGAARECDCPVGVSVTGFAGPDGGTPEAPVGTVFIGCCTLSGTTVREFHFPGSRQQVRDSAVSSALALLLECIR